ncbi:MAG: hypothetical protein Q9160_002388 [Pyrenula sp. 1 TL-2023]
MENSKHHQLDAKVSNLIDQHSQEARDDPDALFDALEAEDDTAFRETRLTQLSAELAKVRAAQQPNASTITTEASSYATLQDDQVLLAFTTSNPRCVVHFFHPDFARCATMDGHLERLSGRHYDARFARIDVQKCPFVVDKLGVRVLPCVVAFKEGVVGGRITGFEGVMVPVDGGRGQSEKGERVMREIERVLIWMEVLEREMFKGEEDDGESGDDEEELEDVKAGTTRRGIRGRKQRPGDDEDDDDDWD